MRETELYDAIECLEKEKRGLSDAPDYRKLLGVKKYISCIKKGDYKELRKMILDKRAANVIKKKKYSHVLQPVVKNNNVNYEQCRIAVYTAVVGDYDNIPNHLVSFANVDYILYVDNVEKYENYNGKYIVKKIPDNIVNKGQIHANRYLKFHPAEFLGEYDYAIYVDGNVRIISDIRPFVNMCSAKMGLAMHAHRERDCVYDEAEVCHLYRRGNSGKIREQMKRYISEGFPKHYGMHEATIIVSDIHNPNAQKFLDLWWDEFERSECKRDQLAWPYVLWKHDIKITDIGCLGNNIYSNYKLEIVNHAR